MIHELKIWPVPFEEIRIGAKAFEVRAERTDGGPRFEAGHVLRLREWTRNDREFTDRIVDVRVVSVLRLEETPLEWGIRAPAVVVMGIELLRESPFTRAALAELSGPRNGPG